MKSLLQSFKWLPASFFVLFAFPLPASAVILVGDYETLTIDYVTGDVVDMGHYSTLNVLTGGSTGVALCCSYDSTININGGAVTSVLDMNLRITVNMTEGSLLGINAVNGAGSTLNMSGGILTQGMNTEGYLINISGGEVHNGIANRWGSGPINISGGTFIGTQTAGMGGFTGDFALITRFNAGINISGGIFQDFGDGIASGIEGWVNIYGRDLTMSTPQPAGSGGLYQTQVSGFLSDGNYIDIPVFSMEGGVHLYNTAVPIPPSAWLFCSGLLGLAGMVRRKVQS